MIATLLVFLFIDEEEKVVEEPPKKVARETTVPVEADLDIAQTADNTNTNENTTDIEDTSASEAVVRNDPLEDLKISDESPDSNQPSARRDEVRDERVNGATDNVVQRNNDIEDLDLGIDRTVIRGQDNDIIDKDPVIEDVGREEVRRDQVAEDADNSVSEEVIAQEVITPDASNDVTKKLLENLEVKLREEKAIQQSVDTIKPTSAPSYEAPGSGLVYNCSGGHWACIDLEEYQKCRDNYAWKKSESQKIECYPTAFLKTDFDCATLQQEKVNAVPDLNFCSM